MKKVFANTSETRNFGAETDGERQLRAAIEKEPENLRDLDLSQAQFSNETWKALAECPNLRRLRLLSAELSEEDLKVFAEMPALEDLVLGGSCLPDRPFCFLETSASKPSGFKKLRHLQIAWVRTLEGEIEEWGLRGLRGGEVEVLSASNVALSASDREGIGGMEKLRDLDLSWARWTEGEPFFRKAPAFLGGLQRLDFRGVKLLAKELEWIAKETAMEWLGLADTEVRGESLQRLRSLRRLRKLELGGLSLQDKHMKFLEPLREMRDLYLGGTKITSEGLRALALMGHLEDLDVAGTLCDDKGLWLLSSLVSLKQLGLSSTRITDQGLEHLRLLRELDTLDLSWTAIGDQGVTKLVGLSKLERLNLTGTAIDSPGVLSLARLPRLSKVSLRQTRVSKEAVETLQSFLPRCEITAD